jgi:hypothetical protein
MPKNPRSIYHLFLKRLSHYWHHDPIVFVMIAAFILWGILFKDFILGQYTLIHDASNYFEHLTYYLENISHGTFPFWDPTREGGVPSEFFLRRIDEFNPFYWVYFILSHVFHWPPLVSYLSFMGFYFLLGSIGMYLAAKEIFNEEISALIAFLLFLFSSMGTLIVCSFTVLIFTPMIWFIFFCLSFIKDQKRWSFLGMVFCLMILVSTYIPFYFLTIFIVLLLCTIVFYFKKLPTTIRLFSDFFRKEKFFGLMCAFFLIMAIIPGWLFHREVRQGNLALVTRHYNAPGEYFLSVPVQRGQFGGIIPHLVVDELLFDAKNIRPSHIYIPTFVFVLVLLGFSIRLNKQLAVFFTAGFFIFIISIYDAPLYKFLYAHVFFFKYFRNYQFFFWIGVLPLFILLSAGHFHAFIKDVTRSSKKRRIFYLIPIVLTYAVIVWVLWQRHNAIISSYIALGLSFLFFMSLLFCRPQSFVLAAIFLFAFIAIEPIEVYHYLNLNTPLSNSSYRDLRYPRLRLPTPKQIEDQKLLLKDKENIKTFQTKNVQALYYATRWSVEFDSYFDRALIQDCIPSPLIVYDHVLWNQDTKKNFDQIGQSLCSNRNLVYLNSDDKIAHPIETSVSGKPLANIITTSSPELKVVFFNGNTLKLKSNFDDEKVLVYYDHFYPRWKAFVNGKEVALWRANVKYKAVFVPKGENNIEFRFATRFDYLFKFFVMGLFLVVLGAVIILWFGSIRNVPVYEKK